MRPAATLTAEPRFWAAMGLASIAGANLGDYVADDLHMGSVSGLPWLALAFATILAASRLGRRGHAVCYWLAVLTVRTAATNIADWSTEGIQLGYVTTAAGLAVLLVAIVRLARPSTAGSLVADMPRLGAAYWAAMFTAGALGTATADGMAHAFAPGNAGLLAAALVNAGAMAAALGMRLRPGLAASWWSYWLAVVAIRTWGTNVGDLVAHGLSRPVSLPASLLLLAGVLLLWPRRALAPLAASRAA